MVLNLMHGGGEGHQGIGQGHKGYEMVDCSPLIFSGC